MALPGSGELYDNNSDPQYHVGVSTISTLLKPGAGQSILDLGCGTGRHAMLLASLVGQNGRVVAVDPNESRVKTATEKAAKEKADNLVILVGDINDVTQYAPFDLIFANFVLHWLAEDDLHATLQRIMKCLKPGGRLVGNMTLGTGELSIALTKKLNGESIEEAAGFLVRPLPFWRESFIKAGFDVEHIRQFNEEVSYFENVYKFFDFFKAATNGKLDLNILNEDVLKEVLADQNITDPMACYKQRALLMEFAIRRPNVTAETC